MFTRVHHWLLALLAAPFFAGGFATVGALVFKQHEFVGMTLIIAAAFSMIVWPIICLAGAWRTWKEGWQERVRMNAREQRYGAPKEKRSWQNAGWQHY